MRLVKQPGLVAHADWGKDPKKRWYAAALLETDGHYRVNAPTRVGDLNTYFGRLRSCVDANAVVFTGFDFPIGLPARYAARVGLSDFRAALPKLGRAEWRDFYEPAQTRSEISLTRPFYPRGTGAAGQHRKEYLVEGLGLRDVRDLKRRCEHRAESLFWLIGPKQVGKAAISGWRDLLAPALASAAPMSIWPFDGPLHDLLDRPGALVVAETYPAAMYGHLRLAISQPGRSKRRQMDRAAGASTMTAWARTNGVRFTESLHNKLENGFRSRGDGDGDDPFDAVVGLLGMLDVVLGNLAAGEPMHDSTPIEGWILGYFEP